MVRAAVSTSVSFICLKSEMIVEFLYPAGRVGGGFKVKYISAKNVVEIKFYTDIWLKGKPRKQQLSLVLTQLLSVRTPI